jgi:hypothetical protein
MNLLYFLWKPLMPLLAVGGGSLLLLLLSLVVVQIVEAQAQMPGPFDLRIAPLGNAAFWVLACAGLLVVFGIALARAAVLLSLELLVGQKNGRWALRLFMPVIYLAGFGICFPGLAIVVFYVVRQFSAHS